jgi:hypothetical protein
LIIDSDFLVFSNRLKHYLEADADFMICSGMHNLHPNREDTILLDPASVPMLWATNIIFNKTDEVRSIFELVEHIKEHWIYYSALYKFDFARFRNDYAFSIAIHIMNGKTNGEFSSELPGTMSYVTDRDILINIDDNKMKFLVEKQNYLGEYTIAKTEGIDVHVMNKSSLLRYIDGGDGV